MAERKMRYTENKVDGRHENGVDGENGNRGFATWGEINVAFFQLAQHQQRLSCVILESTLYY